MASPARGGDGAVIADSVAEFSSTQGSNNWRYGYYALDGDHESFTELCCFDPDGAVDQWWERARAQPPWNLIWSQGQHPDATWTVRRWVAEMTGLVRIDVTTDHWPGAPGATTVRVLSDGVVVYERALPPATGGPLTESVFATVVNGGVLDFTVSADGDPSGDLTLVRAEIARVAVFPPSVTGPAVIEVTADPGLCESSFLPAEPAASPSCQGGTIDVTGARGDGLALDAPYPVGITRLDWLVEEPECPNDPRLFQQWVLVRADGCPDCNGNNLPDDCGVHNLTQDAVFLTIQGALDAAADGDEIVVGPGTFNETIDLLGKALLLRSSDGPEATIIDIGAMPDSVVRCAGGEGPDTVLDGFTITGGASPNDGGGMSIVQSGPTVTGCVFTGNTAGRDGGGMYVAAGSWPTVTRCTFSGNTAGLHGGGVNCLSSSAVLSNCVFRGNSAVRGAGMYLFEGLQVHLGGCVFSGNTAPEGGAMWIGAFDVADNPVVTVTNCTFSGNTSPLGSGMYILAACGPRLDVVNCILWNQDVIDASCTDTHAFEYNDGGPGSGPGIINADPMFVDAVNGDYRLRGGSPCIDAANNAAVSPGADDLDGNPRFVDDGCTPDTGNGAPPVSDMGAYEFQASSCDLDGDGAVGITDMLALLGAWGPCPNPPEACPADVDHDGEVGIVDFLALLADWG